MAQQESLQSILCGHSAVLSADNVGPPDSAPAFRFPRHHLEPAWPGVVLHVLHGVWLRRAAAEESSHGALPVVLLACHASGNQFGHNAVVAVNDASRGALCTCQHSTRLSHTLLGL